MPVAITSIGSTKDIAFFQNADFSRQSPVGATGNILNTDGQIWMGMTTPDIYGSTIAVVNLSSKALTSLTGDSGTTVIGAAKLYGHTGSANAGATVSFNGASVSEMDLSVTDANFNTIIGLNAGNNFITRTGSDNTGIGESTLGSLTSGNGNHGLGFQTLTQVTTGSYNTAVGAFAGNLYTGNESSNVLLSHPGVLGESNVMRLGNQGSSNLNVNTTFIAGIVGVTVSNQQFVTINSSTGQLGVSTQIASSWTDITGATQTMAIGNGYVTNRGGGVTYTLPATATEGDIMRIAGKSGLWVIAQNANQQIKVASSSTTIGVTGSVTSTNLGDCIELLCITGGASTIWRAISLVGNLTIA